MLIYFNIINNVTHNKRAVNAVTDVFERRLIYCYCGMYLCIMYVHKYILLTSTRLRPRRLRLLGRRQPIVMLIDRKRVQCQELLTLHFHLALFFQYSYFA